jgi:tetratricopeptide (TPR) repeat protein
MEVRAGDVALGRYRVGRLIGSGGMGDVYLARDETLRRDVAIKFVKTSAATNETLTRRLIQEARAVASLDNPYICPVYDAGVDPAGRPFMVMQYVEGETLAARLGSGAMPVRDALVMCAQIAEALASAHRRGIIHRDLKPQNILLTPAGQPRLLDFGIAKFLPAIEGLAADDTTTSLTRPHALLGTPAYMSPEQIHERPIDGRSDLFALGCILFECLTGRRAFVKQQTFELLDEIAHVHPPAPSAIRRGLDHRHDALCRRLIAKDPADRFQSADEVVGAIRVLVPDSSRAGTDDAIRTEPRSLVSRLRTRPVVVGVTVLLVAAAAAGLWRWRRGGLPEPPPDAAHYYELGTDALREGAFHSAATALSEAVRIFPNYALAYARRAEAYAEMDDDRAAAQDLVRVAERIPDASRLARDERLRVDAIRSVTLGDPDAAVRAYKELAQRQPNDAGAWVDLARAQESAAQLSEARASAERAIAIDPRYAAARLRLGVIEGFQGQKAAALAAFDEAERLYRASSNSEGEAEVLLRRGALLSVRGDFAAAVESLGRARDIARAVENRFQIVRADMLLGSVMAAQSRNAEAEQLVSAAVAAARNAGLETVAADGLVDLAGALMQRGRNAEAEAPLNTALELAEKRPSLRARARAATQLASVQSARGNAAESLRTLEPALAFFKQHKYRTLELTALSIAARAYQDLDDIPRARELASQGLKEAEATGDAYLLSIAQNNLASQATVLGSLPEALALREKAEAIHRRQNDTGQLAFDLTNRGELLIKLGRFDEAETAMREIDEGAKRGLAVYIPRQRRVVFLRALAAAVSNQFDRAAERLAEISAGPPSSSTSVIAAAMGHYVDSRRGRPRRADSEASASIDPATARDRQYWIAAAALARGDTSGARAAAATGVDGATKIGNDELVWRLAAIGSAAAKAEGDRETQGALRAVASAALSRLRTSWGVVHTRRYEQRPDLVELRRASELED